MFKKPDKDIDIDKLNDCILASLNNPVASLLFDKYINKMSEISIKHNNTGYNSNTAMALFIDDLHMKIITTAGETR